MANGRGSARRVTSLSAGWRAVGRATHVVNDVGTGVLVTGVVGLNRIPAEQRKLFVESGEAVQVGVVAVGEAAVAEANVRLHQRESRFGAL